MLTRLPPELQHKVYEQLTNPRDLLALESVCKDVRDIIVAPGNSGPWYRMAAKIVAPSALQALSRPISAKDLKVSTFQIWPNFERNFDLLPGCRNIDDWNRRIAEREQWFMRVDWEQQLYDLIGVNLHLEHRPTVVGRPQSRDFEALRLLHESERPTG